MASAKKSSPVAWLGSAVFYIWLAIITPIFSLVACLIAPLPPLLRYRVISVWSLLTILGLRWFCGVRWRITGAENIPDSPVVFLSRHESAWETIAYQRLLPPQAFVLKRGLLRIPFFGWGLAQMSPIAIDRGDKRRALREVREQGGKRLADGFSIVVFPEGTRLRPGERRPYKSGGAWLAKEIGVAIVPVAVDSGHCWPKGNFVKTPGIITVSVGKPISTKTRSVDAINAKAKSWIEDAPKA